MKHLLTISALLISSLAMGQWPSLPYNPDDNADGLIGVVDLQGLLANYGNEFASAVVSEDGESAIVYMGDMAYPPCAVACRNLPGIWELPDIEDLGLVWDEVFTLDSNISTWLKRNPLTMTHSAGIFYSGYGGPHSAGSSNSVADNSRCYCAAKQLPRVEYDYCRSSGNNGAVAMDNLKSCVNAKLQSGWQLLGSSRDAAREDVFIQAFWRWAE